MSAAFRRDIEGLRAVAILLVIAYHAGVPLFAGGYVGVDVFFVLSGYLITTLLARELSATGRVDLKAFYARRARRLLPAMAVVVLFTMVVSLLLYAPVEHDGVANTIISTAAYVSNVYFARASTDYLAAPTHTNPLLHTWSLSVEEQFYMFWPLFLVLAGSRRGVATPRSKLIGWMLAASAVSFALSLYWTRTNQPWAFFLPFGRAWEFAAGGLAALLVRDDPGMPDMRRRFLPALGWLGLGGMVAAGVVFGRTTIFPGVTVLLPVFATVAVLIVGAAAPGAGPGRLLAHPVLQAIGRLSYSWYLWHWPLLIFAAQLLGALSPLATAVTVALSLGAAWLSYRWVENPIRGSAALAAAPRRTLTMAGTLAATTIALCFVWKASAAGWEQRPEQTDFSRMRNDFPAIYSMGCDLYFRSAEVKECEFGPAAAAHTAVLLGDSHAGHWFPAVQELFTRGDWRLVVITKSACPVVDATYFFNDIGRMYTECHEWAVASASRIREMRPDLVLVSYYGGYQFANGQWPGAVARGIEMLAASNAPVVLLRDLPYLPFDGPTCLARRAWRPAWLSASSDCTARPLSVALDTTFHLQQEAAARFGNVRTADMTPDVCPDDRCQVLQDGTVTYRDAGHLTTAFSRKMTVPLAHRIDAALMQMVPPPSFRVTPQSDVASSAH